MSASRDPAACLLCGAKSAHLHHPTGRAGPPATTGRPAPYADPAVTVPLCPACHRDEHAVWRALGLADNGRDRAADELAVALLCLRRLAVLAQRLVERRADPFAAAVVVVLTRVADVLTPDATKASAP